MNFTTVKRYDNLTTLNTNRTFFPFLNCLPLFEINILSFSLNKRLLQNAMHCPGQTGQSKALYYNQTNLHCILDGKIFYPKLNMAVSKYSNSKSLIGFKQINQWMSRSDCLAMTIFKCNRRKISPLCSVKCDHSCQESISPTFYEQLLRQFPCAEKV